MKFNMIPLILYRSYEVAHEVRDACRIINDDFVFRQGPNPLWCQTKQGIVILKSPCQAIDLHTPFGEWSITTGASVDLSKLMIRLKLQPMQESKFGQRWQVRQVGNYAIAKAVYRSREEFVDYLKIKRIWEKFSFRHRDLEGVKWELAKLLYQCSELSVYFKDAQLKQIICLEICRSILDQFDCQVIEGALVELQTTGKIHSDIASQLERLIFIYRAAF